jgi:ElaB/YqjD/DUF883 family membrane-anchored ribosome-binding protein
MSKRDPFQKNLSDDTPINKVVDKVTDIAGRMKEQAGNAAEKAGEGLEQGRKSTADTLQRTASVLRDKAEDLPGGEMTAGIVERVADTMESTGAYLREHDMSDMKADVERIVRRNPAQALIIAGVAGFILGRAFRRS